MGKKLIIKKGVSILILLFVYIGSIQAQRDYRKGYIITNMNDTIHGWIDYRGDIRNARICSFRETETGQATDYSPWDISAYRFIDSKFYVSKNIGAADAPNQIFLEYLVNGMANLYYYREDNVNEYYYIEKDGHFHELKIDEIEVDVRGSTRTMPIHSYVGVLQAALGVWEMREDIEKAKLEHWSLIDIARDYHNYTCTDGSECIIYVKRKPLMALKVGPVVGVNLATLKMTRNWYMIGLETGKLAKDHYKFDPLTNFTLGVNLNLSMPRTSEKLSMQMQALYAKYHFFHTYKRGSTSTELHINSNALQMGLNFKYEYPRGKLRPTLAAGGAMMLLPDASFKKHTEYSYGRPSIEEKDFKTTYVGFEVIPGVHYYLANEWIIFVQAQYLQYFNNKKVTDEWFIDKIRSFGILAGIYF